MLFREYDKKELVYCWAKRDVAQLAKCFYSIHKALRSSSASHKLGLAVHTYHPSTGKLGAGEPEVQGHSCLYSKFEVRLEYMIRCLKKKK